MAGWHRRVWQQEENHFIYLISENNTVHEHSERVRRWLCRAIVDRRKRRVYSGSEASSVEKKLPRWLKVREEPCPGLLHCHAIISTLVQHSRSRPNASSSIRNCPNWLKILNGPGFALRLGVQPRCLRIISERIKITVAVRTQQAPLPVSDVRTSVGVLISVTHLDESIALNTWKGTTHGSSTEVKHLLSRVGLVAPPSRTYSLNTGRAKRVRVDSDETRIYHCCRSTSSATGSRWNLFLACE